MMMFEAIPHKERLATLHAICLQISLQSLFRIFPHASVAQSLCGIAQENVQSPMIAAAICRSTGAAVWLP